MAKKVKQEDLVAEEVEYQDALEQDVAKQQPIFIIEEADLKELNDYIQLIQASKSQGILNTDTALEGVIGRLQKYVKRK